MSILLCLLSEALLTRGKLEGLLFIVGKNMVVQFWKCSKLFFAQGARKSDRILGMFHFKVFHKTTLARKYSIALA